MKKIIKKIIRLLLANPLRRLIGIELMYKICSEILARQIHQEPLHRISHKLEIIDLIKRLRPYSTEKKLIRLGPPDSDGGYLVPDDLKGIAACFSAGVGYISGFEEDCISHGMKVFLADKSVDGPAFSEKYSKLNSSYKFIKKFVGAIDSDDFITMDTWVASSKLSKDSDLLLQMDIEGSEYESILSTSDLLLRRFRIIVVEFHYLDHLWNKDFFETAKKVFGKLLQNHTCVHIHPNNHCSVIKQEEIDIPQVAEFTFLRNDRIRRKKLRENTLPHPLDRNNSVQKESIVLSQLWCTPPIQQ